jgi:multidrug efflux pump subunit AcrA (membrane-fusion protein)
MAFARITDRTARIFLAKTCIIAAGAGFLAAPWCEAHGQSSGISVLVVKAANGCFSSATRFTGLVVPRAEAIVNLNMDGYEISAVLVAEGDTVTAGQVLARLTPLASSVSAEGPGGVRGTTTTSGSGGTAAAETGGGRQTSTMALRAPANGVISHSHAKIGDVAAAVPLPPPFGPEPAFRIIVGNELEVEADVLSIYLAKVQNGQLARMRLDNGRELTGHVRAVLPEIDRKTQLAKVRLSIDSDAAIRAGMFAEGSIDASHSCGVSVPRSAVQYESDGTTIQVVRDGVVEMRRVRTGLFSDDQIEVRDGVIDGELVIASAGTSLHDGDRVKPIFKDEISQ